MDGTRIDKVNATIVICDILYTGRRCFPSATAMLFKKILYSTA